MATVLWMVVKRRKHSNDAIKSCKYSTINVYNLCPSMVILTIYIIVQECIDFSICHTYRRRRWFIAGTLSNICRSRTDAPPGHLDTAQRPFGWQSVSCTPDTQLSRSVRNTFSSQCLLQIEVALTLIAKVPSLFSADVARPDQCGSPSPNRF